MKMFTTLFLLFVQALTAQVKTLDIFSPYLKEGVAVKGEVVVVIPPEEIKTYIEKVEAKAQEDPEWFAEYSKEAKPGIPLPYHEKLGLTKEEYQAYLVLWDKRAMEPVPQGEVFIRLEKTKKESEWMLRVTGIGADISSMRYDAKSDTFDSINGVLARLPDIKADKSSILGAWTGREWKLEKEDDFGITKENLAIGKLTSGDHGLIVYRLQEVSTAGRRLYDKSMVIRFQVSES